MKTRKTLEITFPSSMYNTMFRWDGANMGYPMKDITLTVARVSVQRRGDRSEIARVARTIYGATTRTIVG